ncbi:hypothetical protein NESM_000706300 [Novymonas esmeraldas]|uniref:Uncharacterized protein n=1 Tax=Novymonas esmeraldas TaxID=1808958 RepID=A0AAW0EWP8_9TRYP
MSLVTSPVPALAPRHTPPPAHGDRHQHRRTAMLPFRVGEVHTAAFIHPWRPDEPAALSVSPTHDVVLHCAGAVKSDPFPFDEVVFAPFYNTLYNSLAERVRLQFGSALQQPTGSSSQARHQATLVHGDPASHATAAFYRVVRLAAEEVERVVGVHHAMSPYECVFSVVRVYPWGEEDLLAATATAAAAVHAGGDGAAAGASAPLLWNMRTSVPLRTAAQRQLLKSALREVCRGPRREGREDTTGCVQQVRLAVYAPASVSAAGERVLYAEHLFTLVPSVDDVSARFGTTREALCEMLVCRRQGNLLGNPLLPVLLPGMSVDCLTIVTCISARGAHASRACIDACCFGCSGERWRGGGAAPGTVDAPAPLLVPVSCAAAAFERMTGALLMAVAPGGAADGDDLARLDESVDRILAQRRGSTAAADALGGVVATGGHPRTPGDAPVPAADAAAERVWGAATRRLGAETAAVARDMRLSVQRLREEYACEEAALTARSRELRASCAELERREQLLRARVDEGQQRADELLRPVEPAHAAVAPAAGGALTGCEEHYVSYVDAACLLYADAMESKVLLLDGARRAVTQRLSIAALVERAARLQQQCETRDLRVEALERREAELSRRLRAMELEAADVAVTMERTREQRDAMERETAAEAHAAAAAQTKALEEYDECLAIMKRMRSARDAAAAEFRAAAARAAQAAEDALAAESDRDRAQADAAAAARQLAKLRTALEAATEAAGVETAARSAAHAAGEREQRALQETLSVMRADVLATTTAQASARTALDELKAECAATAHDLARLREAQAAAEASVVREGAVQDEQFSDVRAADGAAAREALKGEIARLNNERAAAACELEALTARIAQVMQDAAQAEAERDSARADAAAATAELGELRSALAMAREGGAVDAAARVAEHTTADGVVADALRSVLAELVTATDELAEVEDVMVEESDKAVLALRQCDGVMTQRTERLLDRVATFMDVESRLMVRSASVVFETPSRRTSGGALQDNNARS